MYQYKNGLKCDVPAWRVHAYEALVPIIATVAVLFGMARIVMTVWETKHDLLWTLAVAPWPCAVWMIFCAGLAYWLFNVWCKPVQENGTKMELK